MLYTFLLIHQYPFASAGVLFRSTQARGQLARHVAAKLHLIAAQSIIRMHSGSGMTPFAWIFSIAQIIK